MALLVAGLVTTTTPRGGREDAVPGVGGRRLLVGAHVPAVLPDRRHRLVRQEERLGRRYDLDHSYFRWEEPFPGPYEMWSAGRGRTMLINWRTLRLDGTPVRWRDVARGTHDGLLRDRARSVRQFGAPVLLAFTHEPAALAGPAGSGSAQDYRAAWRRVVEVFVREGVDNVSWVWVLSHDAFSDQARADLWYPGDDLVDWIGVDGFNFAGCSWAPNPWSSWDEIFEPFYAWAAPRRKPLIVAEYGSLEDRRDPARKGRWFTEAATMLRGMPRIRALVHFDSVDPCPGVVDSSPAAWAGYTHLVRNFATGRHETEAP